MAIERRLLRDRVREELLDRLLTGSLPVGSALNEPHLCRELGVSRTPLREALLSLEREGLLEARPGRGWWVAPLTPAKVAEVYPIVGALEALAVRLTPPEALARLVDRLDRMNARRLDAAADPAGARALDDAWHRVLTSAHANRRLDDRIAALKRIVVRRYEYAFMRSGRDITSSVAQHAAVTAALRDGDPERAAVLVEDHWRSAARQVTDWIEPNPPVAPVVLVMPAPPRPEES